MHETVVPGGVLTNWLAIVGLLSLMYWGWRIVAVFIHRGRSSLLVPSAHGVAPDTASPVSPGAVLPGMSLSTVGVPGLGLSDPGAPPEDIVIIAAAVFAMLGAHRIVHLQAVAPDQNWVAAGRWRLQTSHNPG
jgi:hypothetical protein